MVLGALWPASAHAHAELVESAPAANAVLDRGPGEVTVAFSEPVDRQRARLEVVDALGRAVAGIGETVVSGDGTTASATVPALDPDVYVVRYRAVSALDGHATEGQFAFLVDPTGTSAPPTVPPTSTSPSVDAATIAARWIGLLGLLVAFGTLVAWTTTVRRAGRDRGVPPWRLVVAGSVAGTAGVVAYLWLAARPIAPLDGADSVLFDPASAFGWSQFAIAMRITVATSMAAAAVGLFRSRHRDRASVIVASCLLAAALGGMSWAGHAASSGGPAFAAIDLLHLVAVAAWLGALPAVVASAWRTPGSAAERRSALADLLRAHGQVALVAAPVVALTGIANSPLVVGSARDVVASEYGNLVLAKAALLSVAVGLGAVNHLAVRGRGRAATGIVLGAELVVAVVAVSAAATMVTIQPASARQPLLTGLPTTAAHHFGEADAVRVHLTLNPPAPEARGFQVTVGDAATGVPLDDVQRVYVTLAAPAEVAIPDQRIELTADAAIAGLYAARGAYTPVEGDWRIGVVVRRSGVLDEAVEFDVPIRREADPELAPPPDTGIGVPGPIAVTWSLLPQGLAAWLPAVLAMAALAAMSRVRATGSITFVSRALLTTVVVIGGLAAGSRTLLDAANAPSPAELVAVAATRPEPNADAAERGERLYAANCASCHGADGDGDGPIETMPRPVPLGDVVPTASDAELAYRIFHGVAGTPMPPFAGRLSEDERWDVVVYLRSRWDAE